MPKLLIVDDGALSIANELACLDSRVRVLPNERNLEILASRTRALLETHPACRFVPTFDVCDLWLVTHRKRGS